MADKNKPKDKNFTSQINSAKDANSLFGELLGRVNSVLNLPKEDDDIQDLTKSVDFLVSQELSNIKTYSGEEISKYLYELLKAEKKDANSADLEKLLDMNEDGIKTFINENYRSKYLLFQDLKSIGERLVELDEAILTTRDAIISSDDMDASISRTLDFLHDTNDSSENEAFLVNIKSLEKKYKLDTKIQDHIIPKTLIYGSYYAYTIPYSKMIEDYINKINNSGPNDSSNKFEQVVSEATGFDELVRDIPSTDKEDFKSIADNITLIDKPIPLPYLESGLEVDEFYELLTETHFPDSKNLEVILEAQDKSKPIAKTSNEEFKKIVDKVNKSSNAESTLKQKNHGVFSELVKDNKEFKLKSDTLSDIHIELIDPTKMIPIKIFKKCIGYYYIYERGINMSSINNGKRGAFSNLPIDSRYNNHNDKDNTIDRIVSLILRNTTRPMLEKNAEFKELFANALKQFDIKNRNIVVQFIPAEYVTEFKVNLDENDEGTSILMKSLFYAKLYLSILIFKIIAILTRSNDMRVYYVKQSRAEKDITNKTNEAIRSVKENQLDFLDFDTINSNSMLSKVGAARDMFVPMGSSGEKALEMDILSGQDIQLNTDLMEMLRTNMINGTGVPSVIMNFINEADYAKTLVMANSKFLKRVISYQMNFNESITDFYKKIINYSGIINEENKSLIDTFQYTLMKPRSLNTTNMGDLINNTEAVINYMIKTALGENADQTPEDNRVKDITTLMMAKDRLPMLEWNVLENYMDIARIQVEKEAIEDEAIKAGATEEDSGY